jgi:uncharacterized protein with PIN domain
MKMKYNRRNGEVTLVLTAVETTLFLHNRNGEQIRREIQQLLQQMEDTNEVQINLTT